MSIDLIHAAADVVYDALNEIDPFVDHKFEGLDLTEYDYGHETATIVSFAFMLLYSPDFIDPINQRDANIIRDGVEIAFSPMFGSFKCDKEMTSGFVDGIVNHLMERLIDFESTAFGGDDGPHLCPDCDSAAQSLPTDGKNLN